jgi:hypothetical protein
VAQRRSLLYYWKAKEPRFDSACSVDLQMPVMNGIEAVAAIGQEVDHSRHTRGPPMKLCRRRTATFRA